MQSTKCESKVTKKEDTIVNKEIPKIQKGTYYVDYIMFK